MVFSVSAKVVGILSVSKFVFGSIPVLGGSHFFCENQPVPVLTSCYDNLISSLIYIYIYIYRAGKN